MFEFAYGSITGKHHLGNYQVLKAKNNQDAYEIKNNEKIIIGVVADGCGSTPYAEIGARLSSRMIIKHAFDYYRYELTPGLLECRNIHNMLDYARDKTLEGIETFVKENLGDDFENELSKYFLNTIIGFCLTEDNFTIFNTGDGVYAINGEITEIGPFPFNAPPYIVYDLFDPKSLLYNNDTTFTFDYLDFETKDVENFLVGTDGVGELISKKEENIPGLEEKVGEISEFWTKDVYFNNPNAIKQKLSMINKDYIKYDNEQGKVIVHEGLLRDDTTLIVGRKQDIPLSVEW